MKFICGGKIFESLKEAISYSNRYFMEFNVVLGIERME